MSVLRVREAFSVLKSGENYPEGLLVDSSDPNVKGRERLFETVTGNVQRRTGEPSDRETSVRLTKQRGPARRKSRKRTTETATAAPGEARNLTPPAPADLEPSWSDLSDDELLEAFATNVPDGTAESREDAIAQLEALNTETNEQGEQA